MRPLLTALPLFLLVACGGGGGDATTTDSGGSPSTGTTLMFSLPVAEGESAQTTYGIWPFGVHGGGHAYDGHPGIDVEFALGASVRAGADGTIMSINDDSETPGRYTLAISHLDGSIRTDYTNVTSLADGIVVGAAVVAGEPLGVAGSQTAWIGSAQVTYAMTHFQIDDFSVNNGLSNPYAVSPYERLTPAAKALFDTIWQGAAYRQELCEPYPGNDRGNVANPVLTRRWVRSDGAQSVVFVYDSQTMGVTYRFLDGDGATIEEGSVTQSPQPGGLTTVDFVSTQGRRRGVLKIVSGAMTLNYGDIGASRPTGLDGGMVYTTS